MENTEYQRGMIQALQVVKKMVACSKQLILQELLSSTDRLTKGINVIHEAFDILRKQSQIEYIEELDKALEELATSSPDSDSDLVKYWLNQP